MTSENLPATAGGRRRPVRYSRDVVRAFLARVASGESQASIHRDPAMPGRGGVALWARTRPKFAERLTRARLESGHMGQGGSGSTYCPATAQEIFRRICEGESVTGICRDPAMPCFSTVYLWRRTFPEFAEAMRVAREVQAERFCDEGWELAREATPGTAHLTAVRLTQLRWMMGHMAPRNWGPKKPLAVEAEGAAEPQEVTLVVKHYKVEEREDGWHRVVALEPNEETGRLERITPEDAPWHPPPPGRWRDARR
ncbi:hypothetical protein [uncultured Phenylobacterium sp.]|uniref:terminase small subunit-like protein n=1 Tax=uncultured Phenylobacterium sp. TaxID=349273 RepID=UPI0025DD3A67|nr:hypothetical protein [uncultured Phenylobacterium sp.]